MAKNAKKSAPWQSAEESQDVTKLPPWAQAYIAQLKAERDGAIAEMIRAQDDLVPYYRRDAHLTGIIYQLTGEAPHPDAGKSEPLTLSPADLLCFAVDDAAQGEPPDAPDALDALYDA